jgi:hypothetical protein
MVDGHTLQGGLAGISVRFAIATANRFVDLRARIAHDPAGSHVVSHVAFAGREKADLSLGAGQTHDAAAIAIASSIDALGGNPAPLMRTLLLRPAFFDAASECLATEGGTFFFAIGCAVFGACRQEILGPGAAVFFASAVGNTLVVTLPRMHCATRFTRRDAMILDAILK